MNINCTDIRHAEIEHFSYAVHYIIRMLTDATYCSHTQQVWRLTKDWLTESKILNF